MLGAIAPAVFLKIVFSWHTSIFCSKDSTGICRQFSIPHRCAVRHRFALYLMHPWWYLYNDLWICIHVIHKTASREKGILPDFILRHFFSAFLISCSVSLSSLANACHNFFPGFLLPREFFPFAPESYGAGDSPPTSVHSLPWRRWIPSCLVVVTPLE